MNAIDKLKNYPGKTVQMFSSLLQEASLQGITVIDDLAVLIHEDIERRVQEHEAATKKAEIEFEKEEGTREVCPQCGSNQYLLVPNEEGLFIVGCKSCRYSEIKEISEIKEDDDG